MFISTALIFSSLLLSICGWTLVGGSGVAFEQGKRKAGFLCSYSGISFLLLSLFLAFIAGTYWHATP